MNIIGLGNAGCKIAELFKKYPKIIPNIITLYLAEAVNDNGA